MGREYISRLGRRYHAITPGSVYESMVQALVEKNSEALFPEFQCRRVEPYFETAAGDVQPDLVLIGRDEFVWGVVEVEAQEHSASRHVKPQLAKLKYARAEGRARKAIDIAFSDVDSEHLEACLEGPPVVYLVTHGATPVPADDLRTLAVRSINVSIYRGGANDFILKANDDSERTFRIPSQATRSSSPMLRGVWQIAGTQIPVLRDLTGEVTVDFDGLISSWGCSQTSDGYLLRMPTLLFDEITTYTADAYIDLDDQVLVLHASEAEKR